MSNLNNQQKKELLDKYGYLYKAANAPLGVPVPNQEMKKKAFEQVKKEMEFYKLTHQDYLEHHKMQQYLATANDLIRKEDVKRNENQKDTIRIVAGAVLVLLGLVLTSATNGTILFYGAIIAGIGLIVVGAMGFYYNKKLDS